jgi:hypothetical protein
MGAHIHHLPVQHNDPEADFLKSRVYAKLLRGLISKCYQAFNIHPQGRGPRRVPYLSLRNRQIDQLVCNRVGLGLRTKQEMPQEKALLSGDLAWRF